MQQFHEAIHKLAELSIDWTLENLLEAGNGHHSIEGLFIGCENPNKLVTNLCLMEHLNFYIQNLNLDPWIFLGRKSLILAKLCSIGMQNGRDFKLDGNTVFIKINDLIYINELILDYHESNPSLHHPSSSHPSKTETIKYVESYNICKEHNKNNRLERLRKESEITKNEEVQPLLAEIPFAIKIYENKSWLSQDDYKEATTLHLGESSNGMIINRTGQRSKFIISKDIENKLESVLAELGEFTISYFDQFTGEEDESDIIVIQSVDKTNMAKAMKFYK